jgi:D-alanyl-D-alanine carboxypeptidase
MSGTAAQPGVAAAELLTAPRTSQPNARSSGFVLDHNGLSMIISRRDFLISGAIVASGPLAAPAIAGAAQPSGSALDPSIAERLGELVDGAVAARSTPGIALSVWSHGNEVYFRNAGMANLESESAVAGTSVFRIGSLTKQFAAALVLKFVSSGALSLSDPAGKYLPFLARHEPFTVLELLNHTAGVRDGDYDTANFETHSQIEVAQRIARQTPFFDFRPGTAWLYSNANYMLIGAIIERVTGKDLAATAKELLFDPLGLGHTAFDASRDVVVGRVSGYTLTRTPERPFQNAEYLDVALAGAAGAMRSTASDLCRWQYVLFNGLALPSPLAAKMIVPGRLRNGKLAGTNRFSADDKPMGDTQYGLGLMLDSSSTVDKTLIVSHHGGINGFASFAASHLASGLGFACLCNVDTHPALPFRDIRRSVFAAWISHGGT